MDDQEGNVFQDVQTIRNILFGDQHKALVNRIEVLEDLVKDLQKLNAKQAEELKNWQNQNADSHAKDVSNISSRIAGLAKEVHGRMDSEKMQQTELLELLASALAGYTETNTVSTED